MARIWDSSTGKELVQLPGTDGVNWVRFSADASRLATVLNRFTSDDSVLRVWDLSNGQILWETIERGGMGDVQFSPDGTQVVAVLNDYNRGRGRAVIWQSSGQRIAELSHEAWVNSIRFSPDGLRVATASQDKTARVWDARTGQPVTEPLGHFEDVMLAQFSPDGRYLGTVAGDSVRLWDAQSGQPASVPLKHSQRVTSFAFSPIGGTLATSFADKIQVWDLTTAQPLSEPLKHEAFVTSPEYHPDGRQIVTAVSEPGAGISLVRVWDVSPPPVPVAPWLAELLEVVTGRRLADNGNLEAVSGSTIASLEPRLTGAAATLFYRRWTKWFLADRLTRATVPDSPLSVPEYLTRRIQEDSLFSLREAVSYWPTNAVAMARLARRVLPAERSGNERAIAEADWFSRRAATLAPELADAWWSRAEVLLRQGRSEEALRAVEGAIGRQSDVSGHWNTKARILEAGGQNERAEEAYAQAAALATTNRAGAGEQKREYLAGRYRVLKRMNRIEEVARVFGQIKGIPERASSTPSRLIDLSEHFTGSLTDSLTLGNRSVTGPFTRSDELSQLLRERSARASEFDIRGIIELASTILPKDRGAPERIEGIRIGLRCQRLHFLHGAMWGNRQLDGTRIARYVAHYANGQKQEIPVIYGEQVRDWFTVPGEPLEASKATVAWTGSNLRSIREGMKLRMYKFTWDNPFPEIELKSLDVVSDLTRSSLLLIAITAE